LPLQFAGCLLPVAVCLGDKHLLGWCCVARCLPFQPLSKPCQEPGVGGSQALDVSDRKPCMARPLCVRTGSQETVHDCMCRCIGPCLCESPGPWASADWHAAAGGQSRYVGRHGWLDDSLPLWRSSAPRGGCAAERRAGAALLLRRATCRALLGALDAAGADCGAVLALVNPDGVGGGAVGLKVQLCSCVSRCSCWLPMPGKQGHMRGMPTGVGAQRRAPS